MKTGMHPARNASFNALLLRVAPLIIRQNIELSNLFLGKSR